MQVIGQAQDLPPQAPRVAKYGEVRSEAYEDVTALRDWYLQLTGSPRFPCLPVGPTGP